MLKAKGWHKPLSVLESILRLQQIPVFGCEQQSKTLYRFESSVREAGRPETILGHPEIYKCQR